MAQSAHPHIRSARRALGARAGVWATERADERMIWILTTPGMHSEIMKQCKIAFGKEEGAAGAAGDAGAKFELERFWDVNHEHGMLLLKVCRLVLYS